MLCCHVCPNYKLQMSCQVMPYLCYAMWDLLYSCLRVLSSEAQCGSGKKRLPDISAAEHPCILCVCWVLSAGLNSVLSPAGTQFCLHNSGQLSGRDVTSSHLPEATHWPPSHSPQPAPSSLTVLHQSPYSALQRKPSGSLRASGHQTTADAIQLARAASNAAKQSLAATAAITADAALARKGSSSLLADLRQADRQWCEAQQASAPLQEQSPAKAPEVKRSSRQAARAADQSQAEARLASEQPQQVLLQARAQQAEAGAVPMCHTGLPLLRWASRKRAQRVRNQRPRTVPSSDHFLGWTVSGGVLKPIAPRHQPAAAMQAPRAVQAHMWAALPEGRAGRTEPRGVKYEPRAARAEPKLFKAEPVVVAPAAVQAPVDIAPAFIPRHSRKKVSCCVCVMPGVSCPTAIVRYILCHVWPNILMHTIIEQNIA